MATSGTTTNIPSSAIDITRHSSYPKLIRVSAMVIATAQTFPKPSLKNAVKILTTTDIEKAETFWIKKAQESVKQELNEGKFKRLCPRTCEDGIIVVNGGRAEKWLHMSYNQREVILLSHKHRFSRLYTEHIHKQAHQGVAATASKVRSRYQVQLCGVQKDREGTNRSSHGEITRRMSETCTTLVLHSVRSIWTVQD